MSSLCVSKRRRCFDIGQNPVFQNKTPSIVFLNCLWDVDWKYITQKKNFAQLDTDAGTLGACARCWLEKCAVSPVLNSSLYGLLWLFFWTKKVIQGAPCSSVSAQTPRPIFFPFLVPFGKLIRAKSHCRLSTNIACSGWEIRRWAARWKGRLWLGPLGCREFCVRLRKTVCTYA